LSEFSLAASVVVHFADYRFQQVADSNGQRDQQSDVLPTKERYLDGILKHWMPLVVSIPALVFSILSFVWAYKALDAAYKALDAASLANRWAYETYTLTLIADRLSLMQLCAMNIVCSPSISFLGNGKH
jgi:hypothetical protein